MDNQRIPVEQSTVTTISELVHLLAHHPDLQEDIRQCHAAMPANKYEDGFAPVSLELDMVLEPARVESPAYNFARGSAVAWLFQRYPKIWDGITRRYVAAPYPDMNAQVKWWYDALLHEHTLWFALAAAIETGSWQSAISSITEPLIERCDAISPMILSESVHMRIREFNRETTRFEERVIEYSRSTKREARSRGRRAAIEAHMAFYRAWRLWCSEGASTEAFLDAVAGGRITIDHCPPPIPYNTAKSRLRAVRWLLPDDRAPVTFNAFLEQQFNDARAALAVEIGHLPRFRGYAVLRVREHPASFWDGLLSAIDDVIFRASGPPRYRHREPW